MAILWASNAQLNQTSNGSSEDEKTIVENVLEDDNNSVWNTIMVPNPSNYINLGLYFVGHLDSDILLESMGSIGCYHPYESIQNG